MERVSPDVHLPRDGSQRAALAQGDLRTLPGDHQTAAAGAGAAHGSLLAAGARDEALGAHGMGRPRQPRPPRAPAHRGAPRRARKGRRPGRGHQRLRRLGSPRGLGPPAGGTARLRRLAGPRGVQPRRGGQDRAYHRRGAPGLAAEGKGYRWAHAGARQVHQAVLQRSVGARCAASPARAGRVLSVLLGWPERRTKDTSHLVVPEDKTILAISCFSASCLRSAGSSKPSLPSPRILRAHSRATTGSAHPGQQGLDLCNQSGPNRVQSCAYFALRDGPHAALPSSKQIWGCSGCSPNSFVESPILG
mmetsp:Transcript_24926/g.78031  ORF Transcript_24926/g.78031 Transcript_24926/m.78031 type:complete len:305 (-) Transcript_24926:1094-2008(-)